MNKKQLKERINLDKKNYIKNKNIFKRFYYAFSYQANYYITKQIIVARKYKYYYIKKNNLISFVLFLYYSRKNNKLGRKNVMEIHGEFGKNIKIYHQGIIITKNAKLGDNCILHGMNCIGSKDNNVNQAPTIGNNVEIGYGAIVIGNIFIANNITIGANSIVTKSFYEEGITIAGNPAKKIK